MQEIRKSGKLTNVLYDTRGPVLQAARRMEDEGHHIIRLNIGNPQRFDLGTSDELIQSVVSTLKTPAQHEEDNLLYAARAVILSEAHSKGILSLGINDIFLGNGVSELIIAATRALINPGDEVLIPTPDYPLWTAAINLAGGKAVHYRCDEQSDWNPDLDDLKSRVTINTRALVIINPNNPTGAVYPREILEGMLDIARQHELVIFSDEVNDNILFDENQHYAAASLANDLLFVTFNSLSKNCRLAGFRAGWMIVSGARHNARDYIDGLTMMSRLHQGTSLAAMVAIKAALTSHPGESSTCSAAGRLHQQRDIAYEAIINMPGISCVKPKGTFYCFPKLDRRKFNVHNDEQLMLDLLEQQKILLVHGSAFSWSEPDHFRMVFLPRPEDLSEAMDRMRQFFSHYIQE